MNFSWESLAGALESPQISTIYALLALLLLSAASLRLSGRANYSSVAGPISYTLAGLMGLRLVEALTFAYAWYGSTTAIGAMAPLERSLHLATLLALAWVWTQPEEKDRRALLIFAGASLVALVLAVVIFAPWLSAPSGATFNYSDADYAWNGACFVVLLLAFVRLVKARQTAGLLVFGILLVGQTVHLLLGEPGGSMPLATQAAHLLVLPLLFLLPMRKTIAAAITDKQAVGMPDVATDAESEWDRLSEDEEVASFNFDSPILSAAVIDPSPSGADFQTQPVQPEAENQLNSLAEEQEIKQAREELRLALQEVARLHEQLGADHSVPISVKSKSPPLTAGQAELIASIAQELHKPISSIVSDTDLLIGESVSVLGTLQRNYLERVRPSTERTHSLIDNLIRIAELDQAGYKAMRQPVNLSAVIDDAIALLRAQFQEKRIALRVDLPQHLPELNTDRGALQQILYHLLLNAEAATPAEGELTLRAVMDNQKNVGDFLLIQVSDSGGGIPKKDLPQVFSREYRAENPVITGVGDTGVSLSIAETLTQALGGRIWAESDPGVGSTFSVLLPLG